ncbi:MAG: substrate-binding domain-containing protein [Acidimicrobiales bacterium]|nr:substrate-binding domain-containing protein [Acidimicrobiales bacterium]
MSKKKPFAWLSLLLVVSLAAAACGDDDDNASDTTDDTEADGGDAASGAGCPEEVEGDVNISGSSTVEPISAAVGEKLLDCSGIGATVDGPGTGDGFALFCTGETDISDASRPIAEDEMADCESNGVEFIELKVAFDGISVLTNPANEAVECLSFADLYALIGPESQGFDNWSDAQPIATELGSTTELPDAELALTAPGAESGTYDSFLEIVFGDVSEARAEAGKITEDQVETARTDYSSQADDTAIISAMEADDTPLGWVGFAFAEEAGDAVQELAVSAEPGGECIEPSAEAIADGSYPLSRPLFIYVNAANAESNPAVAGYVDYYLGEEGIASVSEVGYVDLPADQLEATRSIWDARTTGTQEG